MLFVIVCVPTCLPPWQFSGVRSTDRSAHACVALRTQELDFIHGAMKRRPLVGQGVTGVRFPGMPRVVELYICSVPGKALVSSIGRSVSAVALRLLMRN